MSRLAALLRRNPNVTWGIMILLVIILMGWLVPALSPYGVTRSTADTLAPPSTAHLFGTDNLGRDVFTRTFAAAQVDLGIAFVGVIAPLVVGTLIGSIAGMSASRPVRGTIKTLIDGVNAIPFIVLALAVIASVGGGVFGVLIAIGLATWARYATVARTRSAVFREADFVSAMRVLGYSRARIVGRHILPNVAREALAYGVSDFMIVILGVASLSFLGAGIRPPAPEWGSMIAEGRLYLISAPWMILGPGFVFMLTGLAVALIAERRR